MVKDLAYRGVEGWNWKTKTTFILSVLKDKMWFEGFSFFDFQLFCNNKVFQERNSVFEKKITTSANSALVRDFLALVQFSVVEFI